jgi:hypothetical protein
MPRVAASTKVSSVAFTTSQWNAKTWSLTEPSIWSIAPDKVG